MLYSLIDKDNSGRILGENEMKRAEMREEISGEWEKGNLRGCYEMTAFRNVSM